MSAPLGKSHLLGRLDREGRVSVQASTLHRPGEEVAEDGEVTGTCLRRCVAPLHVQKLGQALNAQGRLEVGKLEVGVVQGEAGENRLIREQGVLGGSSPLL